MKIPKKVKVAGHHYKVFFDDKYLSEKELVVETNNDFKEIRLCKYYKSKRARVRTEIEEAFLHETLHTIDRNYNNNALSEKALSRLSIGLHQVLSDNFTIRAKKAKKAKNPKN